MTVDLSALTECNFPEQTPPGFNCTQLTGDASTRSYFRIQSGSGFTVMLMKMPEPFTGTESSYFLNYEIFCSAGVPLAKILFVQPEKGNVFLQDLGDSTFYEVYAGWSETERLRYFLRSIEYLHRIEDKTPANGLAFTADKFMWELNYFYKYFLEELRQIRFTENEASELQELFGRLSDEIAPGVRILSHRDYHSRNLMLWNDEVYVIDFQDARFGPVTYDLASLCFDSYIQHSPEFRRNLERMFFTHHPDAKLERFEYPRVCLQRNLKALGTFGYQTTVMKRDFYLQFVPLTLSYVKHHLEKLPEYADLGRILRVHLPEMR